MRRLSKRLAEIPETNDKMLLTEAKELIITLKTINLRWNIQALNTFIRERQRDLFFS